MFNDNEKKFIDIINEAKRYAVGELELDCVNGKWYAMDYRVDWGGAIPMEAEQYSLPLITNEEAKRKGIDIIKCCDECDIYYVG